MTNEELVRSVEELANSLTARATGRASEEHAATYIRLRHILLQNHELERSLPRFVKVCKTLDDFWWFIKPKFGTYSERVTFLQNSFAPLLSSFDTGQISQPQASSERKLVPPVIILIHGIRTQARWQKRITPLLREGNEAIVCAVGYDFLNVFEFLLPGPTRGRAIQKLLWRLDKAIDDNPGREIIVIAHSFGTYCVSRILKEHPRIKPIRVLLCGSIVDRNFRWDLLRQQPSIVNECGTRDIWPLLARSATWGYGASGTFGFKTPGIADRYHDLSHSEYFRESFVRKFWVPFVSSGNIVEATYEQNLREAQWWTSMLSARLFWLPWLGWLFVAFALLFSAFIAKTYFPSMWSTSAALLTHPALAKDQKRDTTGTAFTTLSTVDRQSQDMPIKRSLTRDQHEQLVAALKDGTSYKIAIDHNPQTPDAQNYSNQFKSVFKEVGWAVVAPIALDNPQTMNETIKIFRLRAGQGIRLLVHDKKHPPQQADKLSKAMTLAGIQAVNDEVPSIAEDTVELFVGFPEESTQP